MDHLGFVVAAYGITGVVLVGLIGWTVGEYLVQRRAVAALERSRRRG